MSVLVLVVIAGAAFYFMTPEERSRFFARAAGLLEKATDVVGMCRLRSQDPFYAYVRARVRWPLITYLLVAANVAVLVMMLFGPGALNDPATLVAWGGNFGPRTTDGERWRVVTSIFVHRNLLHLLVNMLALAQVGLIVERIVGPFTFATIFMAAGVLGSILAAAAAPLGVAVGATGGVFGVYGLLLAAAIRGTVQHSAFSMPPRLLKTLAPVAAVFVLYCVAAGEPPPMVRAGLGTGLIGGIALTRSVSD